MIQPFALDSWTYRLDDLAGEHIRREARHDLRMAADKAPVSGFADEWPLVIRCLRSESGPERGAGTDAEHPGTAEPGTRRALLKPGMAPRIATGAPLSPTFAPGGAAGSVGPTPPEPAAHGCSPQELALDSALCPSGASYRQHPGHRKT